MSVDLTQLQVQYSAAIRNGDDAAASAVVRLLQQSGATTRAIYFDVFAPSMQEIGDLWERNEITVAEEHLATAITERMIGQLSMSADSVVEQAQGVIVAGCVAGERHELGLRMLAELLRQRGWRVLYLGADVPTADWVRLAVRTHADAVAISAGAQRHVPAVQLLVRQLRDARPQLQVLVGGAIFQRDPTLWQAVGATLFNADPVGAVDQLTEQQRQSRNP